MDEEKEAPEQPPILVKAEQISADAFEAIIDSFIMREGTDYGAEEMSHEAKVKRIRKQIDRGEVLITFDPNTESVSLVSKLQWR